MYSKVVFNIGQVVSHKESCCRCVVTGTWPNRRIHFSALAFFIKATFFLLFSKGWDIDLTTGRQHIECLADVTDVDEMITVVGRHPGLEDQQDRCQFLSTRILHDIPLIVNFPKFWRRTLHYRWLFYSRLFARCYLLCTVYCMQSSTRSPPLTFHWVDCRHRIHLVSSTFSRNTFLRLIDTSSAFSLVTDSSLKRIHHPSLQLYFTGALQ